MYVYIYKVWHICKVSGMKESNTGCAHAHYLVPNMGCQEQKNNVGKKEDGKGEKNKTKQAKTKTNINIDKKQDKKRYFYRDR